MMTGRCPHDNILFCPLYVAAHMGNGHGCDDGRLEEGGCAVSRDLDYRRAVTALAAIEPRLVAELSFAEDIAKARMQRNRNMRAQGLH